MRYNAVRVPVTSPDRKSNNAANEMPYMDMLCVTSEHSRSTLIGVCVPRLCSVENDIVESSESRSSN